MTSHNVMKGSLESASWQDYRASNTGMVVFYPSDPISEIPIREIPEELPSEIVPEPNYETGTYGYFGCSKSKMRNTYFKSKIRYLIFMTKYVGARPEFKDKYFITGYYRVTKVADVKRVHIRNLTEYSCLDEDVCYALRADRLRFVSIDDAFELTDKIMKAWDYKARITKQTRIVLSEEQTSKVIDFLESKEDALAEYVTETQRLQPNELEEGEESDE